MFSPRRPMMMKGAPPALTAAHKKIAVRLGKKHGLPPEAAQARAGAIVDRAKALAAQNATAPDPSSGALDAAGVPSPTAKPSFQ